MCALCLVITPLIALMKDQVENLKRRGIQSAAIYTGMTNDQMHVALDNCQFGPYRCLYVSPERLESAEQQYTKSAEQQYTKSEEQQYTKSEEQYTKSEEQYTNLYNYEK